eukprot:TRINITY_DN8761_c0_g1_i1.p1 TRINITY_DN8761_c0_g1~~TRINITY_DN8761_c0_g1_i1.p1  ORF type:complete len:370 (+),score=98.65 TRINITY_DN8761_c0_g1_i1:98-1207(+)
MDLGSKQLIDLLRSNASVGTIREDGRYCIIGKKRIPMNAKTPFVSTDGKPYNMHAIYALIVWGGSKEDYNINTKTHNIEKVHIALRQKLLAFLLKKSGSLSEKYIVHYGGSVSKSEKKALDISALRAKRTQQRTKAEINSMLKREVKAVNRNSILSSPMNKAGLRSNFKFAIDLMKTCQTKKANEHEQRARKAHQSKMGRPIIIVPSGVSAIVTLGNVQHFLEKGTYTEKMDTFLKESDRVVVVKKTLPISKQEVEFKIVDKVDKLASRDWDRVVAVFVQGKLWQFRNWKWKTPVEIFSQAAGFHIRFSHQDANPVVSQWNVHQIQLSNSSRVMDNIAVREIWTRIENFMNQKRSRVAKNTNRQRRRMQ